MENVMPPTGSSKRKISAGMIHISTTANAMLTKVVGGYVTELRGEVIIKGKGVMETYWLLGRTGEVEEPIVREKRRIFD